MIIATLKRIHSINQESIASLEIKMSLHDSQQLGSFGSFELVLSSSSWLSLFGWGDLVQLHEFGKIELWLLEDLDLSDHAVVVEWEDFRGVFLNLLSDFLFNSI